MQQVIPMRPAAAARNEIKPMVLSLRGFRHSLWHRASRPGYDLDIFDLTEQAGMAAIAIQPDDDWYTDMPIALIGSADEFWKAEFLGEPEPISSFIFVDKDRQADLIAWLTKQQRAPRIYLYFDFDTYGLEAADNLVNKVAEATFYVPADLERNWPQLARPQQFNPIHFAASMPGLRLSSPGLQAVARLIKQYQSGIPLRALALTEKEDPAYAV